MNRKGTVRAQSPVSSVVGYVRVSTQEQAESGAGLDAQRAAIRAEAGRRGWRLVEICEDAGLGGGRLDRPGLRRALELVETSAAEALMVSKLDRLSRSLLDFAGLMDRSRRRGWSLVALDLNVDTSTPQGALMANVVASFAQYERQLIGMRTREAMAAKKAQGGCFGRPRCIDNATRSRLAKMRRDGLTFRAIAARLNDENLPTAHGGKRWHHSTVRAALHLT